MEVARESPVYSVLEEPLLVAGVDYRLCMINLGVLMMMLLSFRFWYWVPVALLVQLLLKQLAASDHQMRKVYVRYTMQADSYDPWPHQRQKLGFRPRGFGRGESC
jgi:type IV secretory pathway TrbD component